MPSNYKVTFGGWYQRTTLHLSEIYSFLYDGSSKLPLSKEKLKKLHSSLNIATTTREVDYLEYVKATTENDIEIRYYEDGLYVLTTESSNIERSQQKLIDYYENVFNPAISYIFSLGAPTPKILANIKPNHPIVVTINNQDNLDLLKQNENVFNKIYSQITSADVTVFKSPNYIFISAPDKANKSVGDIVEMQIFFREFKDQLEQYLNIHRHIWEEISDIREKHFIRGKEVETLVTKLESYQKTINLISSRINQMSSYIHTRASISKNLDIEKRLTDLFQYKFEILSDTHTYIQRIWDMTKEYLNTALEIVRGIEGKTTNNSIRSIQILASVGVIASVMGYLTKDSLPKVTLPGLTYFVILTLASWPLNFIASQIYKNWKYRLNFPEKSISI